MKLRISIGEKTVFPGLNDQHETRDFTAELPLILKLEDYNITEKISMLNHELASENVPNGFSQPKVNLLIINFRRIWLYSIKITII
jgi:hypothetical protein